MFDLQVAKRQETRQHIATDVLGPDAGRFLDIYEKFLKGSAWLNSQIAAGRDVYRDKVDFLRKVVTPMDALWEKFSQEAKNYLAEELVMRGVLPKEVAKAMEVFNGNVVELR